jgi:hypothetical protein
MISSFNKLEEKEGKEKKEEEKKEGGKLVVGKTPLNYFWNRK